MSFKIRNPKRCDRTPNPLKSIFPSFLKRKSNEKSQTNVVADGVASAAIWTRVQSSWSALPFPLQYRGLFVVMFIVLSHSRVLPWWWFGGWRLLAPLSGFATDTIHGENPIGCLNRFFRSPTRYGILFVSGCISRISMYYIDIYFLCAQTRKLNVIYRHTHTHWLCDSASKDDIR